MGAREDYLERKYGKTKVETTFTDWKPFIDNTQNELNDIEKLGANCYLDYQLINVFYARLKSYMATRWSYTMLESRKTLKKDLQDVGATIFSVRYLTELKHSQKEGYNNAKFVASQAKLLDALFKVLEQACYGFRRYKLLYFGEEIEEEDINKDYEGVAV